MKPSAFLHLIKFTPWRLQSLQNYMPELEALSQLRYVCRNVYSPILTGVCFMWICVLTFWSKRQNFIHTVSTLITFTNQTIGCRFGFAGHSILDLAVLLRLGLIHFRKSSFHPSGGLLILYMKKYWQWNCKNKMWNTKLAIIQSPTHDKNK